MTSGPVEFLIVRPRGGGKTTEAIQRAAAEGGYIVCPTMARAREIWQQASSMGLQIPFPLTGGLRWPPGPRPVSRRRRGNGAERTW
jgi:hypothetical protein